MKKIIPNKNHVICKGIVRGGGICLLVHHYLPLAGSSLLKPAGKGRRAFKGSLRFLVDTSPTADQELCYICW